MINRARTLAKNKCRHKLKKQELLAREQQASLKSCMCTHTYTKARTHSHTHTETGDHASPPLRDVMKHLWLNPCVCFLLGRVWRSLVMSRCPQSAHDLGLQKHTLTGRVTTCMCMCVSVCACLFVNMLNKARALHRSDCSFKRTLRVNVKPWLCKLSRNSELILLLRSWKH